jgi:hypothetical protein
MVRNACTRLSNTANSLKARKSAIVLNGAPFRLLGSLSEDHSQQTVQADPLGVATSSQRVLVAAPESTATSVTAPATAALSVEA